MWLVKLEFFTFSLKPSDNAVFFLVIDLCHYWQWQLCVRKDRKELKFYLDNNFDITSTLIISFKMSKKCLEKKAELRVDNFDIKVAL